MQLLPTEAPDAVIVAHLSFLGIGVQLASAVLVALFFLALGWRGSARAHVREWRAAWFALTVAIAPLFVRYVVQTRGLPFSADEAPWGRDRVLATALYSIYQFGKFAFFGLIWSGAVAFARDSAPRWRAGLVAGAAVAAVVSVAWCGSLSRVMRIPRILKPDCCNCARIARSISARRRRRDLRLSRRRHLRPAALLTARPGCIRTTWIRFPCS